MANVTSAIFREQRDGNRFGHDEHYEKNELREREPRRRAHEAHLDATACEEAQLWSPQRSVEAVRHARKLREERRESHTRKTVRVLRSDTEYEYREQRNMDDVDRDDGADSQRRIGRRGEGDDDDDRDGDRDEREHTQCEVIAARTRSRDVRKHQVYQRM
ncbi:MAG: hypothetical protein NVS4B5_15300 [Vulcanimicrobiaceae bacterium]